MPQALEFHQLDRRLEHLRVRQPARFRHLLASLAESGQQTPILVIQQGAQYLVVDGCQRVAALQQLKHDTVDALVLDSMSEAEALVLVHSPRMNGEPETALEQGWLLQEMESRLNCSIEDLARSFDRSTTWVARRLALVDVLPDGVQQLVRDGRIAAQIAMRYLAPAARVDRAQCERMAQIFATKHWTTREAALFYNAWRGARGVARERILAQPELFLKVRQQQQPTTPALESELNKIIAIAQRALHRPESPPAEDSETIRNKIQHAMRLLQQLEEQHVEPIATHNDSGTPREGDEQARDCAASAPVAPEHPQSARNELHRHPEDRPRREGRALACAK